MLHAEVFQTLAQITYVAVVFFCRGHDRKLRVDINGDDANSQAFMTVRESRTQGCLWLTNLRLVLALSNFAHVDVRALLAERAVVPTLYNPT